MEAMTEMARLSFTYNPSPLLVTESSQAHIPWVRTAVAIQDCKEARWQMDRIGVEPVEVTMPGS
jgi:hypothetical protein